jgi:WD40 repeat protein
MSLPGRLFLPTLSCASYRACVSYTPNASYVLASSLNSTHRLIPLGTENPGESTSGGNDSSGATAAVNHSSEAAAATTARPVIQYAGHKNVKYSISSRVWLSTQGDFLLSGSEDGMVCTRLSVGLYPLHVCVLLPLCSFLMFPDDCSLISDRGRLPQAYAWDLNSKAVVATTSVNQGEDFRRMTVLCAPISQCS